MAKRLESFVSLTCGYSSLVANLYTAVASYYLFVRMKSQ